MCAKQVTIYYSKWDITLSIFTLLIVLKHFIYHVNIYLFVPMLYVYLLLVTIFFNELTTPLFQTTERVIFLNLSPQFFGMTQAVDIKELYFIQMIKERGIVEFVFHMKNGNVLHYKPQLQNKKRIRIITDALTPYIKQICYKRERCT